MKNNEVIVETQRTPLPTTSLRLQLRIHTWFFALSIRNQIVMLSRACLAKMQQREKKMLLFQKATRPPTRSVELCTVRGSAKFFPCTQWTHLYHFGPTGTHLDTARMQKCQTCPHVEWSVHHVFLVSKKQFFCTYYLPRCLAIEVANIVMSSIYIPL